jgi:predicted phage gp36 major capsid-like protein
MSEEDLKFHTENDNYGELGQKDAAEIIERCIGKKIIEVKFSDDTIFLTFADMKTLWIWDGGQSCCERRFMRTDDNIQELVGLDFEGLELSTVARCSFESLDEREIQFLKVKAGWVEVVFSSHNEHNGYYGGFSICVKEV